LQKQTIALLAHAQGWRLIWWSPEFAPACNKPLPGVRFSFVQSVELI
jgi:hypothetical protein